MIYLFRHFAVRLWVSLFTGSLLVIVIYPFFSGQLGLNIIFWSALISFLAIFLLCGWIADILGNRWVNNLIREAGIWERAGNFKRSENIFKKAVSLFDSFLISPVDRRRKYRELSARMARFYLAPQGSGQAAEAFITAYLHRYPEDEEVSETWLQNTGEPEKHLNENEELLYKLGNAQPGNKNLQLMLARSYVLSERSDFMALKAYRRIIEEDSVDDRDLLADIALRFFEDRKTDHWALKAYLYAFKHDKKKTWLLKGIAACMYGPRANGRASTVYKEAGALLSRIDQATIHKLRQDFASPIPEPEQPAATPKSRSLKAWAGILIHGSIAFFKYAGTVIMSFQGVVIDGYRRIKSHKNTKPILKWSVIGIAGVGLVALVVNTASYLIRPGETIEAPVETSVEEVITDPFTIQVAAYLKVEHAEKFVATLKNQALDAYFTEAKGTKSNWYQVRISHFPTKDEARAYGESLKTKGIIDDFYVANYQAP